MRSKFYIISIFIQFYTYPLWAQHLDFYNVRPSRDGIQQSKAISVYNISPEQDLYLLLSPQIPLQRQLAKLAPELDPNQLLTIGNYTIDFWVDGKMVYSENLHPGAILQEDKLTVRPLDIALSSQTRSGLWSINLWDRFMAKSGFSLFSHIPKALEIQIRTYIDHNGIKYSEVVAKTKINITRIPKAINPLTMRPQAIADGSTFVRSKANLDTALIIQLNTNIEQQTYRKINGIVVLKKGELLLEQYYNKENRETLHDPRSVSKSITSTLTGIAIKDGFIKSEQQTLKDFYNLHQYANFSEKKANVKLIDLLSMSAAFNGNDEVDSSKGNEENMYPTSDYTKFTLDLPMDSTKENGKSWAYFTAGTNLVMDVLDKKIPEGIEAYAQRKLFAPLGITKLEWARTPQEKPFGGGGLRMRAIDFAKYGQLYANNGIYNGKRILEKSWVKKSLSPLKRLPADRPGFYGLLFWNKTFTLNGKNYEVYYSSGNGGNKIYIFKNIPIVIVITSSAYGTSFAHLQADEMVEKYLLPAVL